MEQFFRLSNVALILCVVTLGVLLFRTSQSVQDAEDRLSYVMEEVLEEEESLRMLDIEWAYLNSPERLEKLAERYTNLMNSSLEGGEKKRHKKVQISTKTNGDDKGLSDSEMIKLGNEY